MSDKPDKARRKELLEAYVRREQAKREEQQYLSKEQHVALLDFLDKRLGEDPCYRDLRLSMEWASIAGIDQGNLRESLYLQGAYCDCEVLANLDYDA